MSRRSSIIAVVFSGVAACAAPAAPACAQGTASKAAMDTDARTRTLDVARDIIKAARFAALITQEPSTGASARTIDPAPPDSAMVIRFVTTPRSRKVRELARDPRVTLYYFDAKALRYVTMAGRARQVRDAAEKARLWYAEWTPFYPGRERAAALFEVTPLRMEVVSEADRVVGDSVTWAPPVVRFPAPRRKG